MFEASLGGGRFEVFKNSSWALPSRAVLQRVIKANSGRQPIRVGEQPIEGKTAH